MSEKENIETQKATANQNKSTPPAPYIIGIGASAGGLQALDAFFVNVPCDSVAYVIVQHLAPEHRSLLSEILARHSDLKFSEAQHNQPVEQNHVYIIPTGKYLTIKDNCLQLTGRLPDNVPPRPIDTFFTALAQDKASKAIGVILSGTGTDGTEGLAAIKKARGLVLVQEPATAKFDGMPRHAIQAGVADFVLPPELMPNEIFNFVKVNPITTQVTELLQQSDPAFFNILNLVHERTGIDFTLYKQPTLIRRISRRMASNNLNSLVNYLDYLNLHPEEVEALSKEFLINVTRFFRDAEAFEVIRQEVIPALVEEKTVSDTLRIWTTACSTGEEAYSLAILVREYLDKIRKDVEVKIFASDIDHEALDFAGAGIYPESALAEISLERRETFFTLEDGKYRVAPRIRRMVIFAQHNIINDPPFSRMDLVSCRNMLIYLSPLLQKKVIAKFHYALRVGGYLFLGPSESLGDFPNFKEIHKKWKIFRNTVQSGSMGLENFINPGTNFRKPEVSVSLRPREAHPRPKVLHRLTEILNDAVLEEFAYAAVYLDENHNVIHGFGDYKKYLSLPDRQFTFNVLKLVPPDLAVNLGNMLRKAEQDKEKIVANGLQIRDGETVRHMNVIVKPFLSDKKGFDRFILVLISEDTRQTIPIGEPQVFRNEIHYETRVHELEVELQFVKEDLQSVVEELETSNEELQSTNEELLSANEELQSANEELQSLNEELNTINAEHQYKIKILMELDDDLNNFFRSTDMGQVYVDSQLIIRKFTPVARQQINLIEGDVGRSILQITHNINYPDFINDILEAIKQTVVVEREVQDNQGTWFLMRILPYITHDRLIDGAIILFININELKSLHLLQSSILGSSPNAILALKAIRNNLQVIVDFECTLLNTKAQELLTISETDLLHKPLSKVYPSLLHEGLIQKYIQVVTSGEALELELWQQASAETNRWLHVSAVKLNDGLVLSLQDITEHKTYEQQLLKQQEEIRQNAERFRNLLEAVPHITWTNNPRGENVYFNNFWYVYTNLTAEESRGWGWTKAFHPDDLELIIPDYKNCLQTGRVHNAQARILHHADQQYRWHLIKDVPIRNEQGEITMWIGTATDIQEQKDVEEANIQLRLQQQKDILTTVLKTQEAERIRISESLHNGLGQILYASKLNLSELPLNTALQKKAKAGIEKLLDEAITATRNISFELTPSILKDFGMQTALEELIRRISNKKIAISCEVVGFEERPPYEIELALYRIIQELLNNIMKHAQATEAFIELVHQEDEVQLHVQDNGVGFDTDFVNRGNGLGLNSIRNRVQLLNGALHVDSRLGQGTVFRIEIKK